MSAGCLPIGISHNAADTPPSPRAKPGRQVGRPLDDGSFQLIQAFEGVVGQGKNNPTSLPPFTVPVYIQSLMSYTFLVSATSDKYDLWYTRGSEVGKVYVEDENLQIMEGWAIVSSSMFFTSLIGI